MKRILVLCEAGETRSVAMAKVLRERGHFAVAGSYDNALLLLKDRHVVSNDKEWIECDECQIASEADWLFNRVIFMQEGGSDFIGRDEWSDIDYPELREKCIMLAERLKL